MASTIRTAPAIVSTQSSATRHGRAGRHTIRLASPARVGQRPVGLLDLVHPLLYLNRRLARLALANGLAVGVSDLRFRGVRRDAENLVWVFHAGLLLRLCSRRHCSIRPWSPESSTSGTLQPRNSGGRV